MSSFEKLIQSVFNGKEVDVRDIVQEKLDENVKPIDIINKGLLAGMNLVGKRFKDGDMFVPEVLMSARAMSSGIELVKPYIAKYEISASGTVLFGTVQGDLHDIGKNLVGMILESNGYKVIDLGVDVNADTFVEAIKNYEPDILALSALLTTTMLNMKETIELVKKSGLKVKIIIGGAPITKEYANEIDADGYAPDAISAVDLCNALLGTK